MPASLAGVTLFPFQICQILKAAIVISELLLKLECGKSRKHSQII
jgi:hypothetical protein